MNNTQGLPNDLQYIEALAAFIAEGLAFFRAGSRKDDDGWWAVVWKWTAPGVAAEEVAKHGPFETEADAKAEIDSWGKDKAKKYNIFQ
ncbi:MAG: hypothetical protein U0183_15525 [Polyangiaceae bacterium]